ncbi:MAG: hypothetical protein AAF391_05430 [Bacteroidota bacterium]
MTQRAIILYLALFFSITSSIARDCTPLSVMEAVGQATDIAEIVLVAKEEGLWGFKRINTLKGNLQESGTIVLPENHGFQYRPGDSLLVFGTGKLTRDGSISQIRKCSYPFKIFTGRLDKYATGNRSFRFIRSAYFQWIDYCLQELQKEGHVPVMWQRVLLNNRDLKITYTSIRNVHSFRPPAQPIFARLQWSNRSKNVGIEVLSDVSSKVRDEIQSCIRVSLPEDGMPLSDTKEDEAVFVSIICLVPVSDALRLIEF